MHGCMGSSTKNGKNCVVVGKIHVLFNRKHGDVKLGQLLDWNSGSLFIKVRVLLEKAHSLAQEWGGAPVVVAGDFNSTPLSAVILLYIYFSGEMGTLSRMWLTLTANNYQGRMATTTAIPSQHSSCLHLRSTGNIYITNVWKVMPLMVELSYDVLELEWATRYHSNSQVLQDGEPVREKVTEVGSMLSTETVEVGTSTCSYEEEDLEVKACTTQISRSSFDFGFQSGSSRKADRLHPREELKAATGSEQRTVVRHDLLLRSSYAQIEGKAGSRDDMGEPLVTTYHHKFMGTVDYIWHTDGMLII
ncbi:unnamed protein product [Sphagnum troendelagicum]